MAPNRPRNGRGAQTARSAKNASQQRVTQANIEKLVRSATEQRATESTGVDVTVKGPGSFADLERGKKDYR
jgi:hypothetical protein